MAIANDIIKRWTSEDTILFNKHKRLWNRLLLLSLLITTYHFVVEPYLFSKSSIPGLFSIFFLLLFTLVIPLCTYISLQNPHSTKLEFHHASLGHIHSWIYSNICCIVLRWITGIVNAGTPSLCFSSMIFLSLYLEEKWRFRNDKLKWYCLPLPSFLGFLFSSYLMFTGYCTLPATMIGTIIGATNSFLIYSWFSLNCRGCSSSDRISAARKNQSQAKINGNVPFSMKAK